MDERSIYPYFYLGTAVRYLQDIADGDLIGEPNDGFVAGNIGRVLGAFDDLRLTVTSNLRVIHEIRELHPSLLERPTEGLTSEDAETIRTNMGQARPTIDSELGGVSAFVVTDKRWGTSTLLHGIRNLFRPETFDELPELAREDLEEAGKCIAFERPTAAAFHMLRGTEAVLRECYCAYVRQGRISKDERMWGPMVHQMKDRTRRPPGPLLDNLDNIRRNYRNPTQHPDAVYDIHEAQDLFGLCIDAVSQMQGAIKARG
jgi:hypothetical protein